MFIPLPDVLKSHKQLIFTFIVMWGVSGIATANTPPRSDAGADQSVTENTIVQLDGSNSTHPGGQIVNYRWFQIGGPLVILDNKKAAITQFQAPPNALLEFRLKVVDETGAINNDRVLIRVEPYSNQPPMAGAGPDQSIAAYSIVQLSGLGSTDIDGTIVKYKWIQTRGPVVTLSDNKSSVTSFTMPANAQLVFRLRVEDNAGAVATDSVTITANPYPNQSPQANAGPDQSVTANNIVQLSGLGSADIDGIIAKYKWIQTRGPAVTLTGNKSPAASFTMPANAQLVFRLRVEDNAGAVAADSVKITSNPYTNQSPQANAGSDQSVAANDIVQLSGLGSTDIDGSIVKYKWIQTRGPVVTLSGNKSPTTSFTMPANAQLIFRLKVEDNAGAVAADSVKITSNPYTNQKPLSNAGSNQTVGQGATVVLDGTGSTDPDGTIVKFRWNQVSGPSMTLVDSKTAIASFVADTLGDHVFKLKVEDDQGGVKTDKVLIRVILGGLKADAGKDREVVEGTFIELTGLGSSSGTPGQEIPNSGYVWKQISGPPIVLRFRNYRKIIGFIAPEVSGNSLFQFQLTVTDQGGEKDSDTVDVAVKDVTANLPPIANAGADRLRAIFSFESIALDASASVDPDGIITGYQWQITQPNGFSLTRYSQYPTNTFSAFSAGIYNITVTVTDNTGATATDSSQITVQAYSGPPNVQPNADSGSRNTYGGLGGGNSVDPDGTIVSYLWEQVLGPKVKILDPNSANTSFSLITPVGIDRTEYHFVLTVTDNQGAVDTSILRNRIDFLRWPPGVVLDSPVLALEGSMIKLDGSLSNDADTNWYLNTYRWSQDSGPIIDLAGQDSAIINVLAPEVSAISILLMKLEVEDVTGVSKSTQSLINVISTDYQSSNIDAGNDQFVAPGTTVTLSGNVIDSGGGGGGGLFGNPDPVKRFTWIQLSGPVVERNVLDSLKTEFVAPAVSSPTRLIFALAEVTSAFRKTIVPDADMIQVTVVSNLYQGDSDADGIPDVFDAFPNDPSQAYDFDGDGIGDNNDPDRDGDGVANGDDYFPDDPSQNQPPVLTITSPLNSALIGDSSVLVTGTLTVPLNTGVTVNGVVAHRGGTPYGSEFAAVVPLTPGSNTLTITATLLNRKQMTQTLIVTRNNDNLLSVDATPVNAFAPSTISFTITNSGLVGIEMVELDFDGNGATDQFITFEQILAGALKNPIKHDYAEPGLYLPKITILDKNNVSRTEELAVSVQSKAQINQIIKGVWDGMNTALAAGNHGLAMNYLTGTGQQGYGKIFYQLLPYMKSIISGYSNLEPVDTGLTYGEHAVSEVVDGTSRIFLIQFMQDYNGVWRVEGM